jgi:hypothetical protein
MARKINKRVVMILKVRDTMKEFYLTICIQGNKTFPSIDEKSWLLHAS